MRNTGRRLSAWVGAGDPGGRRDRVHRRRHGSGRPGRGAHVEAQPAARARRVRETLHLAAHGRGLSRALRAGRATAGARRMNGEVEGRVVDGEDKGRLVGQAVAPAQTIDRPPEDDENRYHVSASPSESPEAHVLKHDDTFAVLDRFGDISRSGDKQGVYHQGTRFVSLLRLRLQGQRPLLLSSNVLADNVQLRVELTNPDLHDHEQRIVVPHGTLHLARSKLVQDATYFERLTLSNYSHQAVLIEVTFDFASDFVDVVEVRGTSRAARGVTLSPVLEPAAVIRRYRGLDGVLRQTRFEFAPTPGRLDAARATCFIRLESK